MAEVTVDEKNRITLPKGLREQLGITPGTVLEVDFRGGAIVLARKVPVKRPTRSLWGMASGVLQESPKKVAREAIAKQVEPGA